MSELAPGRNIVLIGMMGAGKTTIGRLVAAQLRRPFADTDDMVEATAGVSIADIFASEGERGFRRREATAVRQVAALRGQVVSVGGGAVLEPANVTQLRATGDLVLLDGEPETLALRIDSGSTRPLLAGDEDRAKLLATLRAERAAAYSQAAAHVVDTTGSDRDEVAAAVVAWARRQPGLLSRDELPA